MEQYTSGVLLLWKEDELMDDHELVSIRKREILDELSVADSNGNYYPIPIFVRWYGPTSYQELLSYAETYLDDEDYDEDDVVSIYEELKDYFKQYGVVTDA